MPHVLELREKESKDRTLGQWMTMKSRGGKKDFESNKTSDDRVATTFVRWEKKKERAKSVSSTSAEPWLTRVAFTRAG